MTHAPTDLVGRTLGPYSLERLIGQGGFAWVFAARESDGTPVAVKVLKPRYAGDVQFEARFRNESETAAQLEHPNIIRIRRVARDHEHVLFAMDLCADSLAARLAREGPLPEAEILRIGKDITAALGFAHARGVTLYKAATGELPFVSTDWFELARMHVEEPPPSLRRRRPELSKRFERVVMKCLAKHPDDRYRDAAQLLLDFEEIDARQRATAEIGLPPIGTREMEAMRVPARRPPWGLIAAAGVGVLALIAVVV